MFDQTLHFTTVFFNSKEHVDQCLAEMEIFWKESLESKIKFNVQILEFRKRKHSFNYKEDQLELDIIVSLLNVRNISEIETFISEAYKKWSFRCAKTDCLQWMYVERNITVPSKYKSKEENVLVSGFAFGSIPNASNFVSHYKFNEIGSYSSLLGTFYHSQQFFELFISSKHKKSCDSVESLARKFVVNYDSIAEIYVNYMNPGESAEIFFRLNSLPLFYVKKDSNLVLDAERELANCLSALCTWSDKWERSFKLGCKCNHSFSYTGGLGRSTVLKVAIQDKFRFRVLIECLAFRCPATVKIYCAFLKTNSKLFIHKTFYKFPWSRLKKPNNISSIDKFDCEYAWLSLHSKSRVISDQIHLLEQSGSSNYVQNLFDIILNCALKNLKAVVSALYVIADMVEKNLIFHFESAFIHEFKHFRFDLDLFKLPRGLCYIRRVIMTPSRIIFLPPCEHFGNRIIRKYGTEFMIRVSFQDDNYSKLTYAVQNNSCCSEILQNVVAKKLMLGIDVGSRHYEFLAASTSQLRDHGVWFYAEDLSGNTAAKICKWMGDFTEIKDAAKLMARMGQCFSSSEEAAHMSLDHTNELQLKDIQVARGARTSYNFSDGVGTLSTSLAEEVRLSLGTVETIDVADSSYKPSAFQIRYKGCKGMVAEDPRLRGHLIGIRPSMRKFPCPSSNKLEVVKVSAPRNLFLNKHLITILEQMGVKSSIFLKLQREMMLRLTSSLINEAQASSALRYSLPMEISSGGLQSAGITLTDEPFFRSFLLARFKSFTEKLLTHVRIAVPEEYGRNLLGIVDETKSLTYGQVFVQYSKSTILPVSPLKILQGTVLVTKNPSMHPGDVRKLKAVNVPALHHIKDCIVFPAQGHRPHTDEIAGSDLDGDEFVVIWYKDLIFARDNYPPMDYPVYSKAPAEKEIKLQDRVDFFCDYIKNDNIGVFANAHLVWADKSKEGIFSKQCMQIAKKYPYVLDFAKNGQVVTLPPCLRPNQYPDFMQKGCRVSCYESQKTLGLLYRASRHLEACSSKIELMPRPSQVDPHLLHPGWEAFRESAAEHRSSYDKRVSAILNKYGLVSEAEAFTGCADLSMIGKWRNENTNALMIMRRCLTSIMREFRDVFFQEIEEAPNLTDDQRQERKWCQASAWYVVVYQDPESRFLSFPWIVSDLLAEVRVKSLERNNVSLKKATSTFCSDIDYDIKQCFLPGALECKEENDLTCECVTITKQVLCKWLDQLGLNTGNSEGNQLCDLCFTRIITYFYAETGLHCCSGTCAEDCTCHLNCSPTTLILKFLTFYLAENLKSVGVCTGDCAGFLPFSLQVLALQTLANLAITYDVVYLGLDHKIARPNKKCFVSPTDDSIAAILGDPIKIPIQTEELKSMIEYRGERVKAYLQKYSGVKEVFLHPEINTRSDCFLIVNSIGMSWQRFKLEEFVLDEELSQKLLKAIPNTMA